MAVVVNAIEVYWPDDDEYYAGRIVAHDTKTDGYCVHYDDGDVEKLDLAEEEWRFQESIKEKCTPNSMQPFPGIAERHHLASPVLDTSTSSPTPRVPISGSSRRRHGVRTLKRTTAIAGGRSSCTLHRQGPRTVLKYNSMDTSNLSDTEATPILTTADSKAIRLIMCCVNKWLKSERRRERSTFTAYLCLYHPMNMLTFAAVDPIYESKLLDGDKNTSPKSISTVVRSGSCLKKFDGREESSVLTKIGALVLEAKRNSQGSRKSADEGKNTAV